MEGKIISLEEQKLINRFIKQYFEEVEWGKGQQYYRIYTDENTGKGKLSYYRHQTDKVGDALSMMINAYELIHPNFGEKLGIDPLEGFERHDNFRIKLLFEAYIPYKIDGSVPNVQNVPNINKPSPIKVDMLNMDLSKLKLPQDMLPTSNAKGNITNNTINSNNNNTINSNNTINNTTINNIDQSKHITVNVYGSYRENDLHTITHCIVELIDNIWDKGTEKEQIGKLKNAACSFPPSQFIKVYFGHDIEKIVDPRQFAGYLYRVRGENGIDLKDISSLIQGQINELADEKQFPSLKDAMKNAEKIKSFNEIIKKHSPGCSHKRYSNSIKLDMLYKNIIGNNSDYKTIMDIIGQFTELRGFSRHLSEFIKHNDTDYEKRTEEDPTTKQVRDIYDTSSKVSIIFLKQGRE